MKNRSVSPSLRCIATLLIVAATAALAAEPVRVVETHAVPKKDLPTARDASHDLLLSLYTFEGARWMRHEILAAALDSARVLAQCGVALAGAELRVLAAPRRFHFYSTPVSSEPLREITVAKPAVFFVEDTLNRPAYDAEAIGLENSATRRELANTVWFAYGARDLPLALAHELVHVLSDSGEHSEEPGNLMRTETSPQNTRLSEAQCERMRARGEANGLLVRRVASPTEKLPSDFLPPRGGGLRWGAACVALRRLYTPHPDLPPQGGKVSTAFREMNPPSRPSPARGEGEYSVPRNGCLIPTFPRKGEGVILFLIRTSVGTHTEFGSTIKNKRGTKSRRRILGTRVKMCTQMSASRGRLVQSELWR